jgi:hypothetical protein
MSELLDQAVETLGGAMRASVKLQEDVAQWWNDAFGQIGSVQEWQRKSNAVLTDAIPTAQKAADEYLRLLDQSYHSGLDLLKKAFDSGRSESMADRQARAQELWSSSLETVRNNTQAMAQANVRVMESWAEFLKRNVDGGAAMGAGVGMGKKAARAADR